MADTIAEDVRAPNATQDRDTTTTAYIRFTEANAHSIDRRLPQIAAKFRDSFRVFLFSNPNVEDDDSNDQWQPVRALGIGGHGRVALWKRYDEAEIELDVVAIKEQQFVSITDQYDGMPRGVCSEAVYQHQLNLLPDGENTVKIRRYKYYTAAVEGSDSGKDVNDMCRLYFEFCPHSDLEQLRLRYRAWDSYLPELFLWHMLVSLAKVAVMLENGQDPWRRLTPVGRFWHRNQTRTAPTSFILISNQTTSFSVSQLPIALSRPIRPPYIL